MLNNLNALYRASKYNAYRYVQLKELQEEFARVLNIHNTRIPDSLVEWSWKLGEFIKLPPPPHLVTVINVQGALLHKDSEEAKIQLAGGLIGKIR